MLHCYVCAHVTLLRLCSCYIVTFVLMLHCYVCAHVTLLRLCLCYIVTFVLMLHLLLIASFRCSSFNHSCIKCLFVICVVLILSGTPINSPHSLLVRIFSNSFF